MQRQSIRSQSGKVYRRKTTVGSGSGGYKKVVAAARTYTPLRSSRMPARLTSKTGEVKALVTSSGTAAPGGAALACNSTGSIIPLNLIVAGSSFFNRVGRKIEMKSVLFEANIAPLAAARSCVSDTLRILIVYDRQPNGANPTIANILQDTDQP